jgi:hypothetical protein
MIDFLGTASCSRVELDRLINFVNNFHPALQSKWEMSDTSVSFLDSFAGVNTFEHETNTSSNPKVPAL